MMRKAILSDYSRSHTELVNILRAQCRGFCCRNRWWMWVSTVL